MQLRQVLSICIIAVATASCWEAARIEGVVKDNFGDPLPDVAISITKTTLATRTDGSGKYRLEFVPGRFNVRFHKDGYIDEEIELHPTAKELLPVAPIELRKSPPLRSVPFVDQKDFKQVSACRPATETAVRDEMSVRASGTPTPVPSGVTNFVDTIDWGRKAPALYQTLDSSQMFWQVREENGRLRYRNLIYSPNEISSKGGRWFSAKLPPGVYVYSVGVTSTWDLPRNGDPCFIFAVK